MEKITGIGGVFLKANNVKALTAWYQEHLGIEFAENSYVDFKCPPDPSVQGNTVFSFFKEDTSYFDPSKKQFMINFRVKDLDDLLRELEKGGVKIIGEKEEYEYGKFAWIMDPEGNKIELWQPINGKL